MAICWHMQRHILFDWGQKQCQILVTFKYENLWALKLAKATPLWTPRLILWPRASMTLGLPALISIAYYNSSKVWVRKLGKVCQRKHQKMKQFQGLVFIERNCIRAPFEVFVALRDIVKAKTNVEYRKRPIRNIAQSSRISVRDLRKIWRWKSQSNFFTDDMKFYPLDTCFCEGEKGGFSYKQRLKYFKICTCYPYFLE